MICSQSTNKASLMYTVLDCCMKTAAMDPRAGTQYALHSCTLEYTCSGVNPWSAGPGAQVQAQLAWSDVVHYCSSLYCRHAVAACTVTRL